MKQFYLLLAVGVFSLTSSLNAQNTVTVDASAMQNGFANVFWLTKKMLVNMKEVMINPILLFNNILW